MRFLIKIYFDLLKKYRENQSYPQLEVVKNNLKEKLHYYEKQLLSARLLILDIDRFLSRPIPIPPFLTKELLSTFLNEIYIDLKQIISKLTFILNALEKTILIYIRTNKTWLAIFLSVLVFIILLLLAAILTFFIKKSPVIFIIITTIIISIYVYKKLQNVRYWCDKKIPMLEVLCQQTQNEIESLEEQMINAGIYDISDLERQVDEYLENDKSRLIQQAKDRLRIEQELIDKNPIISFIGINSREASDSHILITDREIEKIKNRYKELLIDENDFYEEKGLDERYRYGVYECFVILLCENFLSYYKCYWNFIKGDYVDEETCEYLFDSIVSVKTQERSSLNQQNPDEKRKYRDLLSLTTMDGKIVYFKMPDDRKQKINSNKKLNYVSDINKAAERIRYWLRQRRVDYQMTRDMDK
ncbi:MAG: hypothetical protein NHB32_25080 [Fischerella sp. CENA71]|nr:hypothetical protein [Fischerella sp. CENA71]